MWRDIIKNNRVVLAWFFIFALYLTATKTSVWGDIWSYWRSGEWGVLVSALVTTLSAAFPVAVIVLVLAFLCAWISYFYSWFSPVLTLLMSLSLLPTVYLVFLARGIVSSALLDNHGFLVGVLVFSNLVLFFFYTSFRKDIHDEYQKEYHQLARLLGVRSFLGSAYKKILLIVMERFKPLFILVFSSTIFAEQKLDISGGIYYLFYMTIKSGGSRLDIFYGQLVFILLFVVVFLVLYDLMAITIKRRFY